MGDVLNLYNDIFCSPIELNNLTMINNTSMRFTNDRVSEIKCIEKKEEFQFSRFVKERLIMGKVPITANTKE